MKTYRNLRDLQGYHDCSDAELGFEKAAPSPLEPKKLNFYNFLRPDWSEKIECMRLKINFLDSLKKDSGNWKFPGEISKNRGVISNYFQVISKNFHEISNYFQQISNSAGAIGPDPTSVIYTEKRQVCENIRYIPVLNHISGFVKLPYTGING